MVASPWLRGRGSKEGIHYPRSMVPGLHALFRGLQEIGQGSVAPVGTGDQDLSPAAVGSQSLAPGGAGCAPAQTFSSVQLDPAESR